MIRLIFLRDVDLIDLAALPTFNLTGSADQLDYRLFFSYLPRPRYPLLLAQFRSSEVSDFLCGREIWGYLIQ